MRDVVVVQRAALVPADRCTWLLQASACSIACTRTRCCGTCPATETAPVLSRAQCAATWCVWLASTCVCTGICTVTDDPLCVVVVLTPGPGAGVPTCHRICGAGACEFILACTWWLYAHARWLCYVHHEHFALAAGRVKRHTHSIHGACGAVRARRVVLVPRVDASVVV